MLNIDSNNNTATQNEQYKFKSSYELQIVDSVVDSATFSDERVLSFSSSNKNILISQQPNDVSVFDVACYVLSKLKDGCSTMKLQKLMYYCQAWNIVWEEKPLFPQRIEAWANGPVVVELFNFHRGMFHITYNLMTRGNSENLSQQQKQNIDEVLDFYGGRTVQWLIDQTHMEKPWIDARKGLSVNERGNQEISITSMQEFYSTL